MKLHSIEILFLFIFYGINLNFIESILQNSMLHTDVYFSEEISSNILHRRGIIKMSPQWNDSI